MKKYDEWFDSDDNKTLLAICSRKLIKNIGIGGIIWGVINIGIGLSVIQVPVIGVGVMILGVLMLGTGIRALTKPSLGVFLAETIVASLLLLWNSGISILLILAGEMMDPRDIIFPLIIVVVFAGHYRKLRHLRELIASVDPQKIEATKKVCKTLVKKKLKDEPLIVETSDRKCRAQLLDTGAFFIQRDLMRAFVGQKEVIRSSIVKPDAKKLSLTFNHPLGKLTYGFDAKNSEKLKNWLGLPVAVA